MLGARRHLMPWLPAQQSGPGAVEMLGAESLGDPQGLSNLDQVRIGHDVPVSLIDP